MATSRDRKAKDLEMLKDILANSGSLCFVRLGGIDVPTMTKFRLSTTEDGVSFRVFKKTLIGMVFGNAQDVEGDLPELPGSIAIAWSAQEDPTLAPRTVYKLAKDLELDMEIVGGMFDGKFLAQAEMQEIASIPSIDVLRARLVGSLKSPLQSLVLVLNAIADSKN